MSILSLGVEHDSCHRVVFTFNSDDEFFTIFLICGQNIEEVSKLFPLFVRVSLDCPGVCVQVYIFSLQGIKNVFWEWLEEGIFSVLEFLSAYLEIKRARLAEDFDFGECVFRVVIGEVMNNLESLANA